MKKRFNIRFDNEGPNALSYELGTNARLQCTVENGVPVVWVNREGARVLAEIFAKLALGTHATGFHVHLGRDLDPDGPDVVRLALAE